MADLTTDQGVMPVPTSDDQLGDEEDHNLLDWWECANCGETGRSSVANCPNCGGMQIGSLTGDFDLPPCWKENSALAGALGVERLWVHLEGPGFIGMQDGEVELVREEIVRGMRPDPEGRPATSENVRELAESYNDEFYEGVEAGV